MFALSASPASPPGFSDVFGGVDRHQWGTTVSPEAVRADNLYDRVQVEPDQVSAAIVALALDTTTSIQDPLNKIVDSRQFVFIKAFFDCPFSESCIGFLTENPRLITANPYAAWNVKPSENRITAEQPLPQSILGTLRLTEASLLHKSCRSLYRPIQQQISFFPSDARANVLDTFMLRDRPIERDDP